MAEPALFISFLLTSMALILMPGPNVLMVVSTSITYGRRRGLQTVIGTSTAMGLQLIIVSLCSSWVVDSLADGLAWLRWLGVMYLLYRGVVHLLLQGSLGAGGLSPISAGSAYRRGFAVSISNPKTL